MYTEEDKVLEAPAEAEAEEVVDTAPAIPELPETAPEADSVAYPGEPVDNRVHDSIYWKFLDKLEGDFRAWLSEARAGELNKSAALRARKASVVLRKSLKEYREVSTAHDRTHGRKNKTEVTLNKEIEDLNK